MNNLIGIINIKSILGISGELLFRHRKGRCTQKVHHPYSLDYLGRVDHHFFTVPRLPLYSFQCYLHRTPIHGVGISILKKGVEVIDDVVIHHLEIVRQPV